LDIHNLKVLLPKMLLAKFPLLLGHSGPFTVIALLMYLVGGGAVPGAGTSPVLWALAFVDPK